MDDGPGASRPLAIVALLAAVTSFWLPWWRLTYADTQPYSVTDAGLFRASEATTAWGPTASGVLMAAACGLLFLRLAARSWFHEPPVWRRDLAIAAGLAAAGVLLAIAWPEAVPHFWGGRTFEDEAAGARFTETAMPVLGWWCGVVAALSAAAAWWRAPQTA